MMSHDDLTCVVPTHNRPQFLRRLLHFYEQVPSDFRFSVVDSSGPTTAAENVAVVNGVRVGPQVSYRHLDLNFIDKCVKGLENVTSPFVVLCADDDLLFPKVVWRCAEFLKNEPGYSSAMGRTAQLNPRLPHGCCRILKGYSIEHDLPFDRCQQLAANWFTNFYAVYRTETLLDIFRITAANTNSSLNYHIPEMLLSQLSALRGRIKVLPMVYSLMEKHASNTGASMRRGVRPQAELVYQRFKECLCSQFVQAGADRAEAERFIDEFYGYFREPNLAIRRRRRSTLELIRHWFHGISEMVTRASGTGFNSHRRFIRADDVAGCESVWQVAVQLFKAFPLGIPANHPTLDRGTTGGRLDDQWRPSGKNAA